MPNPTDRSNFQVMMMTAKTALLNKSRLEFFIKMGQTP